MEVISSKIVDLKTLMVGEWDMRQRKAVDKQLESSIRNHGLLEPLWVKEGEPYLLVDGHGRYTALCKLAGEDPRFSHVPVIILSGTEEELTKLIGVKHQLLKRYGDQARGRLLRNYLQLGLSLENVIELLQPSKGYVSDLRRLEEIPELWDAIMTDKIEISHGRHLLRLEESQIPEALVQVIKEGLSVADTAKLVLEKRNEPRLHQRLACWLEEVKQKVQVLFPELTIGYRVNSEPEPAVLVTMPLPVSLVSEDQQEANHDLKWFQDHLDWRALHTIIDHAKSGLTENQRRSLELYFGEKKSQATIAQELGVVRGTVNQNLKRGMTKMLDALPSEGRSEKDLLLAP